MRFATLTALAAALVLASAPAFAQSRTSRFGCGYTNHETINSCFDRLDANAPKFKQNSATLDFASAAANTCSADLTVTVTGAVANDPCVVSPPNASVNAGSSFTCWVSAADTVTVRHCNTSAGANDPASGTYKVMVLK